MVQQWGNPIPMTRKISINTPKFKIYRSVQMKINGGKNSHENLDQVTMREEPRLPAQRYKNVLAKKSNSPKKKLFDSFELNRSHKFGAVN